VCLSVRSSVWQCLSQLTSWHCINLPKPRITQTVPYNSTGTLVFWCQKSPRNSNGAIPSGGAKQRWGRLKVVIIDKSLTISQKQWTIGTYLRTDYGRLVCAVSNDAIFSDLGMLGWLIITTNHVLTVLSPRFWMTNHLLGGMVRVTWPIFSFDACNHISGTAKARDAKFCMQVEYIIC